MTIWMMELILQHSDLSDWTCTGTVCTVLPTIHLTSLRRAKASILHTRSTKYQSFLIPHDKTIFVGTCKISHIVAWSLFSCRLTNDHVVTHWFEIEPHHRVLLVVPEGLPTPTSKCPFPTPSLKSKTPQHPMPLLSITNPTRPSGSSPNSRGIRPSNVTWKMTASWQRALRLHKKRECWTLTTCHNPTRILMSWGKRRKTLPA